MLKTSKEFLLNSNENMDGAFVEMAFTRNQVFESVLLEETLLNDVEAISRHHLDDCLFNSLKM